MLTHRLIGDCCGARVVARETREEIVELSRRGRAKTGAGLLVRVGSENAAPHHHLFARGQGDALLLLLAHEGQMGVKKVVRFRAPPLVRQPPTPICISGKAGLVVTESFKHRNDHNLSHSRPTLPLHNVAFSIRLARSRGACSAFADLPASILTNTHGPRWPPRLRPDSWGPDARHLFRIIGSDATSQFRAIGQPLNVTTWIWRSALLGRPRRSGRLRGRHQVDEAAEEIMAVAGPGRSLGMILHREGRPVRQRNAAVRAVEQRDDGSPRALSGRRRGSTAKP